MMTDQVEKDEEWIVLPQISYKLNSNGNYFDLSESDEGGPDRVQMKDLPRQQGRLGEQDWL